MIKGRLVAQTIQVWQIPLAVTEDIVEAYLECLSSDERSRAERFRFDRDRRRFVVARGVLRHLLAREFGQTPQSIEFCYGEYGKPSVSASQDLMTQTQSGDPCDFYFNLSHSGEIALCALGYRYRVGVDIEKIKDIQRLDSMMEHCLLSTEQTEVSATDDPLRAFLQRWTCKEAYLKAIGIGLIQSMKTVNVRLEPPLFVALPQGDSQTWQLSLMQVPDDYVAALAVEGTAKIEQRDWQHQLDKMTDLTGR